MKYVRSCTQKMNQSERNHGFTKYSEKDTENEKNWGISI